MKRYALYYAPPRGPLAETAARWLGRDAQTNARFDQPHPSLWSLSASARRYGFHATLKAPFRLADGLTKDDLIGAVDTFAARTSAFAIDGLQVASLDGFLALIPMGDTATLDAYAAKITTRFDCFRAAMTPAERQRRNPDRLTDRQRALLDSYGYPFVLDQFRFHMTLTDRLDAAQAATLRPLAETVFGPVLPTPCPIDCLLVFGESEDGVFHQLHRAKLT